MILQCSDLERALRSPELMPEMRAHAEACEACARQLHLWFEISRVAPQLHQEWESPLLWQRVSATLSAENLPARGIPAWRWVPGVAAVMLLAIGLLQPWRSNHASPHQPAGDLMTEAALQDVQQAEAAYARSIAKLSALAVPEMQQSPSPLAAVYREKLLLLDSAIAELHANVDSNRYNTYLRTELAGLYRDKQETLKDWIQNANRN